MLKDNFFSGATPQIFYEIEGSCIDLYDKFTELIFTDIHQYYHELALIPQWVYHTGVDSDFAGSKDVFNKWVQQIDNERYYSHLFLADCHALLGSVQNRLLSTKTQFQNFFNFLSKVTTEFDEDGEYWTTGENISVVFSTLHDLIITMYSTLDLLSKVSYQFENMPNDFQTYHKMKCSKILFGDKYRINKINIDGTIFENSKNIQIIENLRHELIHNGTWESVPKVHYKVKDKQVIEKFIFLPDVSESGTLQVVKNRKRFFSNKYKTNEYLPILCAEFWERVLATLIKIKMIDYKTI
jgi:hypothetical protein